MKCARERLFALTLAVAFLGFAAPSGARKFQMAGSWVVRNGAVFVPLQFAGTAMGGLMTHVSMGNLTLAFGVPNGPIPGGGAVTAGASAPASIRIPSHRFDGDFMAALALGGSTYVQITTNVGIEAPTAAATFAKLGGPGAFTWCPGDPLCVDGPGTMYGTDPPQGMGGRNGRVIYRAGANRFGGVMRLGLRRGGVNSFVFDAAPFRVGHAFFGGTHEFAVGGLGSADHPAFGKVYQKAGFATQPLTFMAGQLIANPGPKVTTMFGLTNTMAGPVLTFAIGQTPMGLKFEQFTSEYGFAHTTGTVFAQETWGEGGSDFLTFMGYDKRTALGAGNIQLVAGGLSFRTSGFGTAPNASAHRVRMSFGSPVPSLSPGAFAAAGALVLLAAGYALRRRGRRGPKKELADAPGA